MFSLCMSVYFKKVKQKCQGRGFCCLFKSSPVLFLPSVLLFIPFFPVCKYASSFCDSCLKPSWFQINVYFVFCLQERGSGQDHEGRKRSRVTAFLLILSFSFSNLYIVLLPLCLFIIIIFSKKKKKLK